MLSFQQKPIVVDVVKQPPITPEIGMGEVLLNAFGLTGVIMLAALVMGLLVGGIFIVYRRSRDKSPPPSDPGHATLHI